MTFRVGRHWTPEAQAEFIELGDATGLKYRRLHPDITDILWERLLTSEETSTTTYDVQMKAIAFERQRLYESLDGIARDHDANSAQISAIKALLTMLDDQEKILLTNTTSQVNAAASASPPRSPRLRATPREIPLENTEDLDRLNDFLRGQQETTTAATDTEATG